MKQIIYKVYYNRFQLLFYIWQINHAPKYSNGISKSFIFSKMKVVRLADKYSKLKKSSSSLNVFNNSEKGVKEVCKESDSEFK